ncbi:MAG: hypothetical protein PHP25_00975 [Candidatus Moranbacteria bacterium]|nr:hypothetical protein [Candidatus Moranbacteria bacterium]
MIDTIVISIQPKKFVSESDLFGAGWDLQNFSQGYKKFVKNQSAEQKRDKIYRPRPRFINRGISGLLQFEFSIPKLIFGNNVDEVCENDFDNILQTLQARLRDFGIYQYNQDLRKASVSVFHPSKNILLSEGYTASGVIKELRKINLTQKMDLTRDSFKNDGHALHLHANSHELVVYDKIPDLIKPKGRAEDKDKTSMQLSLFQQFKKQDRPPEILRIEARLANKRKMNAVLEKNGFAKNPTFEDIFKESVCKKIVASYWNEIVIKENLFLFGLSSGPKQVLKNLIKSYPCIKPKEAAYLVGLDRLSKDENGIRELRGMLEKQATRRTWYRIANDMKKLNAIQNPASCHGWIRQVRDQIEAFQPLKIDDLLCKEM